MSQATEREQKADLRLIAAELGHIAHTCERLAGTEDELTRRDHSLRVLLGDFAGRRDDIRLAADGLLQALNDLRTHNDLNLPAISTSESLHAFEATLQETLRHYDYADAHGLGDLKHGVEHELGYIKRALDLPIGLLRHITRLSDLLDDVPLTPKDEASLRQVLAELRANPARSSTLTRILPAWRARSAALYKEMKARALWLTPTQVDTVLVVENEDSWQQDIQHLVLDPLRNEYGFEVQFCDTKRKAMDWLVTRAELPVDMKANYQVDPHGFWPEVESWLRENRSRRHLGRTLLVCDLSIPSEAGTAASPVNGREVARFCRDLMPVIVLTTHGSLFDELVRVGHPEVDFVEKGGPSEYPDEWADSLQERVRAHLSPLPMEDCQLEALAFTGSVIVFNGLEVRLTSTEYAIVEALSSPRATRWEPVFPPALREQLISDLRDVPDADVDAMEWRLARLAGPGRDYEGGHFSCPVNEIARRVSLRSLPGVEVDSWGDDDISVKERVREHLHAVTRQLSEATKAHGLPALDEPLFAEREEGPEVLVSLRPHSRVILDYATYAEARQHSRMRRSPESFCILVVEDDAACAELVVEAIHHQGFTNVLTAQTREEARCLLEGVPQPDLVALDLEIPAATGSPSRIDDGLLVRRMLAARQVPPQVIVFTAHSRESVYAKLARVESRADWMLYLAGRHRAFLQKNGDDLAGSAAQVAREAARAYRLSRKGNWSDVPSEGRPMHRVRVPPLNWPPTPGEAVPMQFWVDDRPVELPDKEVMKEFTDPARTRTMYFLNLLAQHDNLPLHVDWLALELVNAGVFSTEAGRTRAGRTTLPNYKQRLDRCRLILVAALTRAEVKDKEVLISTGDSYELSGLVSIG